MSKPLLGLFIGGLLGILDGLSAWFSPEARPMMVAIVAGSLAIGSALSTGVAIAQGDHYLEIVVPGMLVGGLTGFAAQRYPQGAGGRSANAVILAALGTTLAPCWCPRLSRCPCPPIMDRRSDEAATPCLAR